MANAGCKRQIDTISAKTRITFHLQVIQWVKVITAAMNDDGKGYLILLACERVDIVR
jgi:hypothetical protein